MVKLVAPAYILWAHFITSVHKLNKSWSVVITETKNDSLRNNAKQTQYCALNILKNSKFHGWSLHGQLLFFVKIHHVDIS